ncbi:MAG TPA: alpha-L-arabinofuranosidase C-terminal domain-containing protein [Victivallales bacterium]|nr:alpha-L-arabinofuranosidase C-terminal domain-containing protein [Victivallales bacterium]
MNIKELSFSIDFSRKINISPELIGIFFEDISFSADGGLYGELIQNRSFEYSQVDQRNGDSRILGDWHHLTGWTLIERNGGKGVLLIDSSEPIHPNNPHYLVLGIRNQMGCTGICNSGYDGGIPLCKGEYYNFSIYARQLTGTPGRMTVCLEDENSNLLDSKILPILSSSWKKYTLQLFPKNSTNNGRLLIMASHPGRIGIDMVSLFPSKTFKNHQNGLRNDLAQCIADLKPKFIRFPGGCLVHGDGVDNMYNWKYTIGPIEFRKSQRNIRGYHQSLGLGFYEYLQFCEDIGAIPIPIFHSGVSCQNAGGSITGVGGRGQIALGKEALQKHIQDIIDFIEFANGPASSTYGKIRTKLGHSEPFNVKYIGIGNEEHITSQFKKCFYEIFTNLKKKCPEITVIGTVGPSEEGRDFEEGWKFAKELNLPIVDEHYYLPPEWFWKNLYRYDSYDRNGPKVYLGEYAAHEGDRSNSLSSALAEAAFLTSLERNADIVKFASYAPLLGNINHLNWRPNLIYFDKIKVIPTINYYIQKMFSEYSGNFYIKIPKLKIENTRIAISTVFNSNTGNLIVKVINGESENFNLKMKFLNITTKEKIAIKKVLRGNNLAATNFSELVTEEFQITITDNLSEIIQPYSFNIIIFKL